MARPTIYNEKLAGKICAHVAEGLGMRVICAKPGMPSMSTVFRWLAANESFRELYARAKDEQADLYADEIVAISDEADVLVKHEGDEVRIALDSTAVARNRLRVDARKWVASKLKPRKYGDRIQQELTGADGGPVETLTKIEIVAISPEEKK